MAFQGWDPRMIQETMRQGYLDQQEIMKNQQTRDTQNLQNAYLAQKAADEGLFSNNPDMQARLGISQKPLLDWRDLQQGGASYSNPTAYGAPQPMSTQNGRMGPPTTPMPAPVVSGGYRFPTQDQQDAPQMPSPGPYASGYVNAPGERAASTGPDQPGPWAQTVTQPAAEAAPVPESFTKQTLLFLKKQFGDDAVDMEKGTVRPDLQVLVEKIQAKQAELESLAQQNQLKYGTQLNKEQMLEMNKRLLADEANKTHLKGIDKQTAAGIEEARIRAAADRRGAAAKTPKGITGGKDPILDQQYANAQAMKLKLASGMGAVINSDAISGLDSQMAQMEAKARGGGMPSPPAANLAPGVPVTGAPPAAAQGKTIVNKQHNYARKQTKIIYSDGTSSIVDGIQ